MWCDWSSWNSMLPVQEAQPTHVDVLRGPDVNWLAIGRTTEGVADGAASGSSVP